VLDVIVRGLKLQQIRATMLHCAGIVDSVARPRAWGQERGSVRRASVLSLVERSDIERTHATHVARLALRIFDQTQDLHHFRTGERELLEYAALLHEVGMHVAYQNHHHHSYYLISHAGLRGFTTDQVAVMANVARYYRKSPPRDDDDNFVPLSESQKDVVRRLSAILRIADALDRGRRRAVRDVGVEAHDGSVHFHVRLRGEGDVESRPP
jgi:exopolyphosphatase/guanosine-5'-triphosphate,3'-diphosphate pyrophosphatase